MVRCPYCGSAFAGSPQYCPNCRQPLSRAGKIYDEEEARVESLEDREEPQTRSQRWLMVIAILMTAGIMIFGLFRLYYWSQDYRITRLYTRGEYTPTVNAIMMDDGRLGHSIVFYGNNGDQVFLPEMQKSITICGNVARINIADADWFSGDVTDIESAIVHLTPILIDEHGMRTQLPEMSMEIAVPDSPIEVIAPAEDRETVITSHYELQVNVIPGSTVLLNNENISDFVQRDGVLTQNVNVYPIGDNVYTFQVQTPQHHETRRDVVIYRQKYDIEVEIDASMSMTSQTPAASVHGTIEQGATIAVETSYNEESMKISDSGAFSFIANLSNIGDNIVRFRVQKEGREDALISLNIEYVPSEATYTSRAWAMDYENLNRLYEQWSGKIFLCKGTIIDSYTEDGSNWLVMNIGSSRERQLLILENKTKVAPTVGRPYTAYADVTGHRIYRDEYYPCLAVRYLYSQ